MRFVIGVMLFFCFAIPCQAETERYLGNDKVFFEDPQEDDVLKVNLSFGFLTVLEFPEKPVMVAVGDNSLLQIEVPQNSRNVVVKPLEDSGVTNLFVFTPSKRFNYQVVIGGKEDSDYVVDVNESAGKIKGGDKDVSLVDLIKMTGNYQVLKELGNINDRKLIRKRVYQLCEHPKVNIALVDLFKYKDPKYLIVHFTVRNADYKEMNITEKNTKLYANGQALIPQYVFFDKTVLKPEEKTNGWLFLKDSYVALDNQFQIAIGAEDDKEYKCR